MSIGYKDWHLASYSALKRKRTIRSATTHWTAVYHNSSQIIDTTKREQLIQWTKSPWAGLFNSAIRYSSTDNAEPVQLLHRPTPARRGPFWDTQFCLPREKGVSQYIQVVTPHNRHFRHIYKRTVTAIGITGTQTAGSAWLCRYVQRSAAVYTCDKIGTDSPIQDRSI